MENTNARLISGSSSIFLDSLRICAAFIVLYIHAKNQWFPSLQHDPAKPGELSHAAVIVFFVLSGFVIAHTTISKNRGGMQYAKARLTRLGSVVIPALIITALIQLYIHFINPELLFSYSRGFSGIRYILSGLFINEIWFFSAAPPLNISLWSLSFEFWYYAIFGLWFFRKPGLKSLMICIIACALAGPKILLMMPIWLSGYFAYRLSKPLVSSRTGWLIILTMLLIAGLAVAFLPSIPYMIGYKPLYYANQFITDWITGIFVAAALWMLPAANNLGAPTKFTNWFRKIADLTFPLYVLHYPLLVLLHSLIDFRLNDNVQLWLATISVAFTSMLLGWLLDKQRFLWAGFFKWVLNFLKGMALENKGNTIT